MEILYFILIIIFTFFVLTSLLGLWIFYNTKKTKKVEPKKENPDSQSPTPKKSKDWIKPLKSVLWTLILLSLAILLIVGIIYFWPKVFNEKEDKPKAPIEKIMEPVYRDDYELKKGEEIIIHIKPNYHYGYEGYGKKYYRQSFYQNGDIGPKELIGGGIPLKHNGKGSIKVIKVILSVYEEEGKITVYHSKNLKELMRK